MEKCDPIKDKHRPTFEDVIFERWGGVPQPTTGWHPMTGRTLITTKQVKNIVEKSAPVMVPRFVYFGGIGWVRAEMIRRMPDGSIVIIPY